MASAALSLYRPLASAWARIVAFPHAGGGASAFRGLRTSLAARGVELCPLQPPGRENRSAQAPHASIEAAASEFADAVQELQALPTAFLGHSLGGLIAYRTACRLASDGAAPFHLIASDSLSPTLPRQAGDLLDGENLRAKIIALGGIPQAILDEPSLFAVFAAIIQADLKLGRAYVHVPGDPLPCPITVYSGREDRQAPPGLAPAWQSLTRHALRTRSVSGGHFFLYADPENMADMLIDDITDGSAKDSGVIPARENADASAV